MGGKTSANSQTDLRSFGRRRGRTLSPRQASILEDLLPRVRIDLTRASPKNLDELFAVSINDVWLEIGFGAAEHLLFQAQKAPDVGVIGCEPYVDGVVKALCAIEDMSLGNVRVHDDDARDLLRWLPDSSLAKVFVLFPDPWPKVRHQKRRLVNASLFEMLGRTMRPGGRLLIATDIPDYARTILIAAQSAAAEFSWCARSAADWRERPWQWPATRYEQKAIREGRVPYFFVFERCADSSQRRTSGKFR